MTATPSVAEDVQQDGDSSDQAPSATYCRDLKAQGFSYADSVSFWLRHGGPDRMDADLNGVPCETVYSVEAVTRFFRGLQRRVAGLDEPGMYCRDLRGMGFGFPQAMVYWLAEGRPDRMDADLNGIPCETVYTAAEISQGDTAPRTGSNSDTWPDTPLRLPPSDLGPGSGYTVTCRDGSISHSGGIQGACSHHGGVSR